jgi:hypothetical protein
VRRSHRSRWQAGEAFFREIRPPTPRSKATVCTVTRGNIGKLVATAFARLLIVLLSVRTIGYTGEQRCGGESVSQSPLKDQAFSTFLDQNPPFELRPKWNSTFDKNLCRSMGRHRQHCHQETSESQIAIAPLGLIAVQVSETGNVAVRTRLTRWRRSDDRTRLQRTSLQTGNFTGNFAEISHSQTSVARETPELQRLFQDSLLDLSGK